MTYIVERGFHWACNAVGPRLRQASHINLAFADQALVSGANFAAGILFARFLGIEQFGRFALAWMIVELTASLQYAAILQPMLNIGPKHADDQAKFYYDATLIQQGLFSFASAFLVSGGVFVAARVAPSLHIDNLTLPLGIAVAGHQLQYFVRRYFFTRARPGIAFLVDSVRYAIQIGALFVCAFAWTIAMTAATALWIVAGSAAIAVAVGASFIGHIRLDGPIMFDAIRRHWLYARWLLPSAFMFALSGQAFYFAGGATLGASAVGALKAAMAVLGIINVLLLALDNFAPSQASRALFVGGTSAFHRYMRSLAAGVATLTVGVAVAIDLDPGTIVHVIYGSQYDGLGYLVRCFSALYVVYSMSTVLVIWAAAIEAPRMIFVSYTATATFAVIFAYPLARFGVMGIAVGLVLSEVVRLTVLLFQLIQSRPYARIRPDVSQSGDELAPADDVHVGGPLA